MAPQIIRETVEVIKEKIIEKDVIIEKVIVQDTTE